MSKEKQGNKLVGEKWFYLRCFGKINIRIIFSYRLPLLYGDCKDKMMY